MSYNMGQDLTNQLSILILVQTICKSSPILPFSNILMSNSMGPDQTKQLSSPKIVSEYDQEIPLSQTADNPYAPRGRAAQPSRDTRKTN